MRTYSLVPIFHQILLTFTSCKLMIIHILTKEKSHTKKIKKKHTQKKKTFCLSNLKPLIILGSQFYHTPQCINQKSVNHSQWFQTKIKIINLACNSHLSSNLFRHIPQSLYKCINHPSSFSISFRLIQLKDFSLFLYIKSHIMSFQPNHRPV